jgi:hypothetical protein
MDAPERARTIYSLKHEHALAVKDVRAKQYLRMLDLAETHAASQEQVEQAYLALLDARLALDLLRASTPEMVQLGTPTEEEVPNPISKP